jgi:hypothetical protein
MADRNSFKAGLKAERESFIDFLTGKVDRHKHIPLPEGQCSQCTEFNIILKFIEDYVDAHNCGCYFCAENDYDAHCNSCVEACLPCQDQFDEPD